MYATLRKDSIPIEARRAIIIGRFRLYRTDRVIIRYLPDEVKDHKMQEMAKKSNEKQRAKRVELMHKPLEEAFLKRGATMEEAKEAAADPAIIKEALLNYSDIGGREGSEKPPEERRKLAAMLTAEKELSTESQTDVAMEDIIVELAYPTEGVEGSIHAIQITNIWKKLRRAYLRVNKVTGRIVLVASSQKLALESRAAVLTG